VSEVKEKLHKYKIFLISERRWWKGETKWKGGHFRWTIHEVVWGQCVCVCVWITHVHFNTLCCVLKNVL